MRRPVTGRVHPVTVLSIAVSSACLLMIIIVGPSSALPHHTFPGVHNPFGDPSLYPEYYGPEAETTTPYPRRNRHRDSSYWEPYRPDSSVVDDSGRSNRHQVSGSSRMDLAETSHTAQDSTNSGDSSSSASTAPRDGSNSAGVTGADSNKAFAFPNHNFTLPKLYEMYWKLRQEGKTLKEHFENAPLVPEIYGMNIRDGHGRRRRKFSIDEVAAVVAAAMRLSSPSGAASINEQQYPAINPRESLPSHRDTRNAATQGSHPQQGYVTDGVGHNRALDHPVVPDIVRPARESNPGYPDVDDAGVLEQQGQQHQFIDSISLLHPEAAELLRPYYNEQHGAAGGLVPHGQVDQFSTYQPSAMLYPGPSYPVYHPYRKNVDYYWRLRQEEEKRLQQVKYNIRNRINRYATAVRRDFWETTDDPTAALLSSTGTWEAASGAQNALPFHDEIQSSVSGPLRPAVADRTAFVQPAEEPLVPDLDAIAATHIHRARSWPLLCGAACAQPGRTLDRRITPVNVLWGPFIAQGFNRRGTPSRPNPISGNGARKSPTSIPTVMEQPTVLERTTTTKPIPPQPIALNPAFADYYEDENVADDIDAARTTTTSSSTTGPRPLSPTVNPAFADYYEDDSLADQDNGQGGDKVSARKRPFNQPFGEVVNSQPAADTSFKQESEDGSRFSPTTSASQPDALLDTGINTQSLNVVRVTESGNADGLVMTPTGQNAPGSLHSRILNGPYRPYGRTPRPTKEPRNERIRGQLDNDGPKTNKPSNYLLGSGAGGSSSLAHHAVDCESCVRLDQERIAKNTETFESELKRIAGNRREQEEEDRQALILDELEDSNSRDSDLAQRTRQPSMPKTTPRKGRPSSSDFEVYNLPGPMPSAASSRSDVRVEDEEKKTANSGKGRTNNDGSKFVPNFDQKEQVYRNLAEADQEESVPDGGDGLDFLNDATAVQPSPRAKSVLLAPTDGQSQPRASEQPATAVVQPKGVFASILDGAMWLGTKVQQTAQNAYQTIATGLEPAAAIAPADGGPLRSSSVATNQVPAGNTLTNYNKSPHDKYPHDVSFELSLNRRRRQVASSSSSTSAVKNDNEDFAVDARDFEPPSHLTEEERRTWKGVVGLAKDYASRFSGIVVVDPQQQQEDSLDNRKAVIVDTAKANREDFVDKIGQAWSIGKDKVVENIDALGDALNQQ